MSEAEQPDKAIELREICADIGELVSWDVHIDDQLTKAVIYLFGLRDSELLEYVVSEIPVRQRKTMLSSAAGTLKNEDVKGALTQWLNQVETLSKHRNTVAHHSIALVDGEFVLHSNQLSKLLKIVRQGPDSGPLDAGEVRKWKEKGEAAFAAGQPVLKMLAALHAEGLKRKDASQTEAALPVE